MYYVIPSVSRMLRVGVGRLSVDPIQPPTNQSRQTEQFNDRQTSLAVLRYNPNNPSHAAQVLVKKNIPSVVLGNCAA